MSEEERQVSGGRRADGTFRKAVKVRAGFASEELNVETRAYMSKGAKLKEELKGYVPGASPAAAPEKSEADKRRERRQRKKEKEVVEKGASGPIDDVAGATEKLAATTIAQGPASAEDNAKEVKKLSKLLRQIEKIEEDKVAGKEITKDQADKLARKSEVIASIAALS
jgi:partner of Y14 and mago protein